MTVHGSFAAARAEIDYAYDRVAAFRSHMETSGLTPADVQSPADFELIPPTSKQFYRRNYPAGILARGTTLSSAHVMRFQSSGTGGERLNSAILSYDLARRQATALSVNDRFAGLWRPGARLRICRYAPPNCSDVECASGLSTAQERILPDGTLVLPVSHDLLSTPDRHVHQALDEIASYAPDMLVVDPTHLAFLSRKARAAGRRITSGAALHVVCGYTLLTRIARRQIEDFMGPHVPVADMLGMSELGYIGFECHHGRRHLNSRDFYVELLDAGRRVQPGQVGELVITTIDDSLIPRIRYATGDLFTLVEESCPCGSDLPVVRVEGRASHCLQLGKGKRVTPGSLDACVGNARFLDLYRMDQLADGSCRFRYIANAASTAKEISDLAARLASLVAPRELKLDPVDYIPCERSGKFQSCASEYREETLTP